MLRAGVLDPGLVDGVPVGTVERGCESTGARGCDRRIDLGGGVVGAEARRWAAVVASAAPATWPGGALPGFRWAAVPHALTTIATANTATDDRCIEPAQTCVRCVI
ncbi:MAG: hypothetical protein ACYDHH_25675 [Solirubrobacteraceae bacterium]